MYAIIQSGGHQYRVAPGEVVTMDRLGEAEGDPIEFSEVLLIGGEQVTVGTPWVDGAVVRGTVLGDDKGPKLTVFKYKRKKRYRIKTGHRQKYTRVQIDGIDL